jgi:hypothetical protein
MRYNFCILTNSSRADSVNIGIIIIFEGNIMEWDMLKELESQVLFLH